MSGLEPLAIFGIACNVMQTINFAQVAITTFDQIREDGRIDPKLREAASDLQSVATVLSTSIRGGSSEDAELISTARKCSTIAQDLVKELDKLTVGVLPGRQKALKAIGLSFKKWRNKSLIEKLEKELKDVQGVMETRLLSRTCTKVDAIILQQEVGFSTQAATLQRFINERANDHTKLTNLITTEASSVKDHNTKHHIDTRSGVQKHTTSEHIHTRKALQDHTTSDHDITKNYLKDHSMVEHRETRTQIAGLEVSLEAMRLARDEQTELLKSLDFPGRAWRMNDIKEAHCRTFQWLLGDSIPPNMHGKHSSHGNDTGESGSESDASGWSDKTGEGNMDLKNDKIYADLVQQCKNMTWDSFTTWLTSSESIYWIKAKAGAGKSTLMKFLCEHPRTKDLLSNGGARSVIIVSHSFFLMAQQDAPLKCNIKGFLCNVIYQLVMADDHGHGEWINALINQHPQRFLRGTTSCTDWGIREFRQACLTLLKIVTKSSQLCLFIDGLDEVHPSDGKLELLRLLTTLKSRFPLKMCVSSRPEVEFERGLSSNPTLELHSLTASDMYLYAFNLLHSAIENSSTISISAPTLQDRWSLKRRLAENIVEKADGVFLWADIATKALERGATNGDTWPQMNQRLDRMPVELNQLFASMWKRLGNDQQLYRDEAALYFNLVLEWSDVGVRIEYGCCDPEHEISDEHDQLCNHKQFDYNRDFDPTLFQLVVARRELFTEDLGTWNSTLKTDSLWDGCVDLFARLPVMSAGLLEFSGPLWLKTQTGHKIADFDIDIQFIHRTAKEFFTESLEGRKILGFDKSSYDLRFSASFRAVLSRGLASTSFSTDAGGLGVRPARVDVKRCAGSLKQIGSRVGIKRVLREIHACQAFHDHGIGVRKRRLGCSDFLSIAISVCLKDYVVDVFDKPSAFTPEYKTHLLVNGIEQQMGRRHYSSPLHEMLDMINFLLEKGCQSNSAIHLSIDPSKSTGLESFWRMIEITDFEFTERHVLDNVIDTLWHFERMGADFTRPMYRFTKGKSGSERIDYHTRSQQVFVECSILWAMMEFSRAQHISDGDGDGEVAYFRSQLGQFVRRMISKEKSLRPIRILAVLRSPNNVWNWMAISKRVPNDKEPLLTQLLGDLMEFEHQDSDSDSSIEDEFEIQRMFTQMLETILNDDAIPLDVTDYLLYDLGFAQSWPLCAAEILYRRGITCSGDLQRLPDGIIWPPVKYIDQAI